MYKFYNVSFINLTKCKQEQYDKQKYEVTERKTKMMMDDVKELT